MKKSLIIAFTIPSLVLILDSMNAGHAFTMLLLAGIVPGTNLVINAEPMLEFFALLIGFVLARITVRAVQAFANYRNSLKTSPTISVEHA